MMMTETETHDYDRVAHAIQFLEAHYEEQPTLEALAAELALSPFHTQRLFTRWAGISPKRFIQHLTLDHARSMLANAESLLTTTYAVGLSSPSRLHDLFVKLEGVTPAEYKRMGDGLRIEYGYHMTPFGEALIGQTARGICGLYFTDPIGRQATLNTLADNWPKATLVESQAATYTSMTQIFERSKLAEPGTLSLFVKGTNFQIQVWEALLRIPEGMATTYGDVARLIDKPKASRAVGSAVARNGVAYLIPCHRVIRKSGKIDAYRWGGTRKKAMLAWESAHVSVGR